MDQHCIISFHPDNADSAQTIMQDLGKSNIKFRELNAPVELNQLPIQYCHILLISDRFLKTADNLSGLLDMLREGTKQLLIVKVPEHGVNANGTPTAVVPQFRTINEVMYYRDFWYNQWIKLRSNSDQNSDQATEIAKTISTTIGALFRLLNEMNPVDLATFQQDHYQLFFDKIDLGHTSVFERFVKGSPDEQENDKEELPKDNEPEPFELNLDEPKEEGIFKFIETDSQDNVKTSDDAIIVTNEAEIEDTPKVVKPVVVDSVELLFESIKQNRSSWDEEKLIQKLEAVIDLDNQHIEAYLMLADVTEQRGDALLSRNYYEKALSIAPNNPQAHFGIGNLLKRHFKKKHHQALLHFKKAVKLVPDNPAYHFAIAGLLFRHFNNTKKALKHYNIILSLQPDNEKLSRKLTKLGNALYNTNAEKQTLKKTKKLLSITKSKSTFSVSSKKSSKSSKIALITGATSGIGKACAFAFAQAGYDVIITGRRKKRLKLVKEAILKQTQARVLTLCFDVRMQKDVEKAINTLEKPWKSIDVLINNAGLAKGLHTIDQGELEHWETMIDTNVKGLLYMTKAVSQGMVKRQKGHIINIGSTAGKEVYSKGNVYCATKHAVDALTKGMRIDLHQHQIRVASLHPGHVETEFAFVRLEDEEKAKIYEDFQPLKAEDVANTALFMATSPAHVNIADVVMMSSQQANATTINRNGRPKK